MDERVLHRELAKVLAVRRIGELDRGFSDLMPTGSEHLSHRAGSRLRLLGVGEIDEQHLGHRVLFSFRASRYKSLQYQRVVVCAGQLSMYPTIRYPRQS